MIKYSEEANVTSDKTKRNLYLTGLFAAFMFLQFVVLGLGNRAGEGYLSAERREWVYYALQVFVILGFLAYAAADRFLHGEHARRTLLCAALVIFAVGTATMLFAGRDSLFYVILTYAVMPCLGFLGGAVYHRMSRETAAGEKTARSMGVGCAVAVALQFFLQLRWGVTPLLPVALLGALILLALSLLRTPCEPRPAEAAEAATPRQLLFACLIAVTFVLFTSFYNGYIHHLQIQTGYTDYNVYSWPRLLLIPCYLLFAAIGDLRRGKLVPIAALCIALVAMLNSVLRGAYWLNMCLYYCAIAAFVSYYNLTFWHLAQRTRRPALWASVGRIVDSGMVLLAGGLHISALPAAAVLALNIGGLAVTIVLLSVSGAFNLTVPDAPPTPALLPENAAFDRLKEKYALTPRETEVLRELVLTEDKQTVICERLSIQVKALQKYVTQLYRKTGAATRSGLTELYHNTRIGL